MPLDRLPFPLSIQLGDNPLHMSDYTQDEFMGHGD
jgi:hypothetical protein